MKPQLAIEMNRDLPEGECVGVRPRSKPASTLARLSGKGAKLGAHPARLCRGLWQDHALAVALSRMTDIGWRKTDLGDNENDFVAYEAGEYVGRVYLVTTAGTDPYWGWFPAKGGGSGKAPSRREAMLEVEKWWRLQIP